MSNNEFKRIKNGNSTRYVLENSSAGATSSGSVASSSSAMSGVRRRQDNILAQETDKKIEPAAPRNFVAKNAKMGGAGAHRDKKKEQKQGKEKHRKPFDMAESSMKRIVGYRVVGTDIFIPIKDFEQDGRYYELRGHEFEPVWDDEQDVGENSGVSKDKEIEFHTKLDKLVHRTFGKRKGEMEDRDHPDHEISMASNELLSIADDARRLLDLVRRYSEIEGLEAWQQSKITKAADYLNSVLNSLRGDQAFDGDEDNLSEGAVKELTYDLKTMSDQEFFNRYKMTKADARKQLKSKAEDAPKGWEGTVKAMKKHKDVDNPYALANWMKSKGYKSHKEDAYMEELAAKVAEKLDPNAEPEVWIQDFQQADPKKYPQFRGKSAEKKARMAIAARYDAKQPKSKK